MPQVSRTAQGLRQKALESAGHSSKVLIQWICGDENRHAKKAAGVTGGLGTRVLQRLFGRNLARRVECAGIVDLGDLVVAEAQHLAQDFVGVFAQ